MLVQLDLRHANDVKRRRKEKLAYSNIVSLRCVRVDQRTNRLINPHSTMVHTRLTFS